jgi:hypothetical protein
MGQRRDAGTRGAEQTVRDIRRATRRKFSAEEKIRIVLEGLRGEDSIAELCRKCRQLLPEHFRRHPVHKRQCLGVRLLPPRRNHCPQARKPNSCKPSP